MDDLRGAVKTVIYLIIL